MLVSALTNFKRSEISQFILRFLIGLSMFGCAPAMQAKYRPPQEIEIKNERIVNAPLDEVWSRTLPKIAKTFFSINNLEKESGFLNLSYSGDPGSYVDCGSTLITKEGGTQAINLSDRTNTVNASAGDGTQATAKAHTKLDTKINVVFEKETDSTTKISVNIQYHLYRSSITTLESVGLGLAFANALSSANNPYDRGYQRGDVIDQKSGTAIFTSGQTVPLPNYESVLCRATGHMESYILSMID